MELTVINNNSTQNNNGLEFNKAIINDDYRKKWNIHQDDYVYLTFNGELVNQTLYRKGGMFGSFNNEYNLILKHVEAFYDDSITKEKARKPHLKSIWVIIDKKGVEKVELDQFSNVYLVANSVIYIYKDGYYNIETGECYAKSIYNKVESENFLFLEDAYNDDKNFRGVIKINKKTGEKELIK